ncbi:glycoside hydrolase family 55 protein [Baudoinia panamericana UAMH 10762]|uniref:Glycoside hydrolase family 55 protein n=1 Tax=Baudoinia panamericana (strain UAMH 10762) TaxID=717646 RepID=M2MLY7_BAUPA|nr:glycoside hydrolase family 55 protein [Baudoinia panamericana UAMH 10762]EMC92403.1 glycoside hydrolase family 55 protein [Baudoinia panamericana UAMH 10762]
MHSFCSSKLLTAALGAILSFTAPSPVAAAPTPQAASSVSSTSSYWLANPKFHQNRPVLGNPDASYPVWRNVMDFGAKGDGVTDDTNAINIAINATYASSGSPGSLTRCGVGCNSSTTVPAGVYFPAGTYLVSTPIIMEYYTQMIGDPTNPPTLLAASNFVGMAVVDSNPYGMYGVNWYINQNNFFRQVRNFVIDIRQWGGGAAGAGIHWQVAQATSLQNIVFKMSTNSGTKQQGIFMDNGSGGFMADLVFEGGLYGAFLGNQQFTSRNWTFNNCQTGIFMNWNWGWTLSDMTFNNCGTGIDMSNSPTNQTVGSVVVSDSTFSGVTYGIKSAFLLSGNVPATGGTLVVDNCDMTGATHAVVDVNSNQLLAGGNTVVSWGSGNVYDHSGTPKLTQGALTPPMKNSQLTTAGNKIFSRTKPQYERVDASQFLSAITDGGLKGDGTTDDTSAMQSFLNNAASQNKIAYFDHATYRVTQTVVVPENVKIVGEVWSTILATGFTDSTKPTPVWQIGTPGQTGYVEISDMLFEMQGSNPGAIMIEWNLNSAQGKSGIWDTHVRMGGSAGSNLLYSNCAAVKQSADVNQDCVAGFMMFHATPSSGGVYLENVWLWTADHDMEDPLNRQISVYNARGMLIQSQGPVWLWGTASEHSVMYNYQFDGVKALFAGFIQTETPYMQPYPLVPTPFQYNNAYDDPTFTICTGSDATSTNVPCKDAWGLRIVNSNDVMIMSTGMYSFFNGYTQDCVPGQNCQENMIRIQNSHVSMYAVTTKAAVNMIIDDNGNTVKGADNRNVFGDTVCYYNTNGGNSTS